MSYSGKEVVKKRRQMLQCSMASILPQLREMAAAMNNGGEDETAKRRKLQVGDSELPTSSDHSSSQQTVPLAVAADEKHASAMNGEEYVGSEVASASIVAIEEASLDAVEEVSNVALMSFASDVVRESDLIDRETNAGDANDVVGLIGPVLPPILSATDLPAAAVCHEESREVTQSVSCTIDRISDDSSSDEAHTSLCYDFTVPPRLLITCKKEFKQHCVDLPLNNFLKGCKWSPDGTCLLTNSEDRQTRVFVLPEDFYSCNFDVNSSDLTLLSKVHNGEIVYDYCWFSRMSSVVPDSCLYVTTSKDQPIHMWDAIAGQTRCTYKAINHLDEMSSAHSLSFSMDGQRLYAGFKKAIRVFDVNRPGKQVDTKSTIVKGVCGQAGIISCLAMSPNFGGVFAAGCYDKSIALYADNEKAMQCMFRGQRGGITQLMFSPCGRYLVSGARKDNEVLCWDMRNAGNVLFSLTREVTTNQRIHFDLDATSKWLLSGSTSGEILVWNIHNANAAEADAKLEPSVRLSISKNSVNGASLNPSLPLLATTTGERVLNDSLLGLSGDDNDVQTAIESRKSGRKQRSCSVQIWNVGPKPLD